MGKNKSNSQNAQGYESKPKSWNDISKTPSKLNSMGKEKKHIFAAYLNLAQHNAFSHLNHIAKKMGITERGSESNLSKHPVLEKILKKASKNSVNYKLADADYAMRLLFTEFPFLKILVELKRTTEIDGNDEKKLAETLKVDDIMSKLSVTAQPYMLRELLSDMFVVLNYHRNHHTHFMHSEETLDHDTELRVAKMCNFALMALRRLVKTRFAVNPKDNPDNEAKKFLYLEANDLDFLAKGQYKFNSSTKKAVPNPEFFYAMIKNDHLTSMGLVLLTCMFLPRNYIMMFIDQLGDAFYGKFLPKFTQKNASDSERYEKHRRIMREIFGYFNLPLIKDRYRSEREDIALALDMLNELKRCPKLLYDHLSPKDQNSFKVDISTSENSDTSSNVSAEMVLKRHTDRFPYFALRYIDERGLFSFLRFHVNYGKYRFMLYDNKKCVDGSVQPRVLQYDLNGFGRLSEVEKIRSAETSQWLGENVKMLKVSSSIDSYSQSENEELPPDSPDILPYVTNCGTHYQFYRDKIGLRFLGVGVNKENQVVFDEKDSRILMPKIDDLKAKADAKSEAHRNKTAKDSIAQVGVAPNCWLSTYELPAMAFYTWLSRYDEKVPLVKGNDKILVSPTEKIVWDCIRNYHKLFQNLRIDKLPHHKKSEIPEMVCGIKWKDIPQKIRKYMLSDKVDDGDDMFDSKVFLNYARNVLCGRADRANAVVGLRERTQRILDRFLDDFKAITGYEFSSSGEEKMKKDKSVKKNQAGRRSFTEIKPGRLSTYLARDIVALQEATAAKPTGLNYNIMQKAIAQYGGENGMTLDELKRLFVSLGLLSTHPFLSEVLDAKPSNTLIFYYRYLIRKIQYLNALIGYVDAENIDELEKVPFLHANQQRFRSRNEAFFTRLADEYIGRPIELPTGLFTDAIREKLAEIPSVNEAIATAEKKRDKSDKVPYINAAWLIKQYHQLVLEDKVQPMYGFKRNYKLFDSLWPSVVSVDGKKVAKKHYITPSLSGIDYEGKTVSSTLNDIRKNRIKPKQSSDEQRLALRAEFALFDDRERLFRRYQVQDIVTFLMAKDILTADYTSRDSKNKEINHNHELEEIRRFKLSELRVKTRTDEKNIIDFEVPFSVTLTIDEYTVIISQEAMKVKNYGDFFRFVNDTRIVNLLPYLPREKDAEGNNVIKITRKNLEQELLAYDNNRTEIYRIVHELEKYIIEKFPELKKKTFIVNDEQIVYDGSSSSSSAAMPVTDNFRAIVTYLDREVLQIVSPDQISDQVSEIMIEIRNAFGHNRYTDSKVLSSAEVKAQLSQIAGRIRNIMKNKKNAKINQVKPPQKR